MFVSIAAAAGSDAGRFGPLEQSHQSAGLLWGMVPVPLREACTLYHGTERRLPASIPSFKLMSSKSRATSGSVMKLGAVAYHVQNAGT